jgi:hypothetical protein
VVADADAARDRGPTTAAAVPMRVGGGGCARRRRLPQGYFAGRRRLLVRAVRVCATHGAFILSRLLRAVVAASLRPFSPPPLPSPTRDVCVRACVCVCVCCGPGRR